MTDPSQITVTAPKKAKADPNQLTLIVNGTNITGWESIELTLRAEGFPNNFSVSASMQPGNQLPVSPGDVCIVLLGSDTVITGYVDRVADTGSADSHMIQIQGRGKTQDLVDCGAEWPSGQMVGGNALVIANNLALPYGIAVELVNGASAGPDVPQWPINYGESAAAIIQRVARNASLLAYETHEGKLGLAQVGTVVAASGIAYGENVQAWSVEHSMDQRFSEYVCMYLSVETLGDLAGSNFFFTAPDTNVNRHRRMYLAVEAVASDPIAFTKLRANWESQRRAGRSFVVSATVDSWRDSAGTLWTPNTLVPVDVPGATGGAQLVISEVTFRRSNAGTTADLVAMPASAFTPEPIVLQPVNTADLITAPGAT